jgi:hypothetical protein
MGMLSSPVASINGTIINPWPTRVTSDCQVVRCQRVIVGKTPQGTLFSNVAERRICYSSEAPWGGDIMRCLSKLGVITAEQAEEHIKNVEADRHRHDKAYRLYEVMRSHHEGFLVLPVSQRRRMWDYLADARHWGDDHLERLQQLGMRRP